MTIDHTQAPGQQAFLPEHDHSDEHSLSAEGDATRRRARSRAFVRRLFSNRLSVVGVVLLGVVIIAVALGPFIWRIDPGAQNLSARTLPPSAKHPLGTDALGRDVLSRVLHGGRLTIAIAFVCVCLSMLTGGLLGLIAGFFRGIVDSVLMRIMDVLIAIPNLILAIAIATALGPGIRNTILAVVIPGIPGDARMIRSVVLSVRERDYVFAARACGVRPSRIMVRHVLANSMSTVVIMATVSFGFIILIVAGLGFLGLGVQPPHIEWGTMLTDARTYIVSRPVVVLAPGLAIFLVALAGNLIGDALRDALDPSR